MLFVEKSSYPFSNSSFRLASTFFSPLDEDSSFALASSLGEEGSKRLFLYLPAGHEHYPGGREDFAHTSTEGAQAFAKIIARNLIRLGLVTVKEGLL